MSDITLTVGATVLHLSEDLFWEDEHAWSATEQAVDIGLTGAPILHLGLRQHGRPITLTNHDADSGWLTRADLAQLSAWADIPGQRMTLDYRGTQFQVIFRHHDGGAISARPRVFFSDSAPGDYVLATLRLMTVPPLE